MKPAWDKLAEEFKDSKSHVIQVYRTCSYLFEFYVNRIYFKGSPLRNSSASVVFDFSMSALVHKISRGMSWVCLNGASGTSRLVCSALNRSVPERCIGNQWPARCLKTRHYRALQNSLKNSRIPSLKF